MHPTLIGFIFSLVACAHVQYFAYTRSILLFLLANAMLYDVSKIPEAFTGNFVKVINTIKTASDNSSEAT